MSDSQDLKFIYGTFSMIFHFGFFLFLVWNRHFKNENLEIPVKYLKLFGLIGCIIGIIFYIYGDQLINQ